jgi:hypothetical protein
VQSIDLDLGKKPHRLWVQGNGLKPIVPWSAKQCTADRAGDKDAVLIIRQELGRGILQSRGDPDVAAEKKGAECVECAAMQSHADRALELLLTGRIPHHVRHRIERVEDAFDRGTGGLDIHDLAEAVEVQEQNVGVGNRARAMPLLDAIDSAAMECKTPVAG